MLSLSGLGSALAVIIGISFIIFVHELGHFLVARWCGVRCLVFSIGMGPRLASYTPKGGQTEYRLAWIPIGGYVLMAGEDEQSGANDELESKSVGARAAIFLAGVTMNLIFAVILFAIAFSLGVRFISPEIGHVSPGSPAWHAGLAEGDIIRRIGTHEILNFDQISLNIAFADAQGVDVEVERQGRRIVRRIVPLYDKAQGIQVIGIGPAALDRLYVVRDSPAYQAGLRSGDKLLRLAERESLRDDSELIEALRAVQGDRFEVVYARDGESPRQATIQVSAAQGYLVGVLQGSPKIEAVRQRALNEEGVDSMGSRLGFQPGDTLLALGEQRVYSLHQARELVASWPASWGEQVGCRVRRGEGAAAHELEVALPRQEAVAALADLAERTGEPRVGALAPGSPAEAAGITPGSVITHVAGHEIKHWADLVQRIGASQGQAIKVDWLDANGAPQSATIQPRAVTQLADGVGFSFDRKLTEEVRYGLGRAILVGMEHSREMTVKVVMMLRALFTSQVSASNLGGPILIAQASYAYVDRFGLGRFLYFLGLLSVNLVVLNLLPIPGLDGGHLVFLLIEATRGEPLPETATAIFRYLGVFMILALVVFVFFNDVMRLLR
jgi:regulator of sigma E protease